VKAHDLNSQHEVSDRIGEFSAKRYFRKNWRPVDERKHTVCGTLHRFNVYDGFGDEMDWNNYIIPDRGFKHLIDTVKELHSPDTIWDCTGDRDISGSGRYREDNCIEVEITPDESFFENPWFPRSNQGSRLEGNKLCAYGPWVYEAWHGKRPEIHPSQLIWWKEADGAVYLMFLEDDSNRFHKNRDFDVGMDPPRWWLPWAKSPRTAQFRIPFKTSRYDPPLVFDIWQEDARNVHSTADGKHHELEHDGKVVVEVHERNGEEDTFSVEFEDVCQIEDSGVVYGNLAITSTVGFGDRTEGYQVLRVAQGHAFLSTSSSEGRSRQPELSLLYELVPETVTRSEANGRSRLIGDIRVIRESDRSTRGPTVSRVELVSENERISLSLDQPEGAARSERGEVLAVVKGVPILDEVELELTITSGEVMKITVPGVSLVSYVEEELGQSTVDDSLTDAFTWAALRTGATRQLRDGLPRGALTLRRVRGVEFRAVPRYASLRGNEVRPEDDSPLSRELNRSLTSGDDSRGESLFGSSRSIMSVEWSFSATKRTADVASLTSETETIPVSSSESVASDVRVEFVDQTFPNGMSLSGGGVRVFFPDEADAIYEVVASARITDSLGLVGEVQHTVWSKVLLLSEDEDSLDAVVRSAARLVGARAEALIAGQAVEVPEVEDDPQLRSRMARLYVRQAAEDGYMTISELERLLRFLQQSQ
jgi:hypothetical protein